MLALLVPAAAQAKPQTGAVLRVDRAHHKVEVVNSAHLVRRYTVAGKLSSKLRSGALVTFKPSGKRANGLRVTGRTRKLAFYATVVSSARKGAVLRLPDGRSWKVGKKQLKAHKSSVSISLEGLDKGQVVLITMVSDSNGNVSITIKLVKGDDPTGGEDQDATGTVTYVSDDTLTIDTGDEDLTFVADADLLADIQVDDEVDVTYYEDNGTLVADDVSLVDDGAEDDVVTGTVTQVRGDGLTVNVDGEGAMSFSADPDVLQDVAVGDVVDVSYYQDDDGSLVADDVEPADLGGPDDSNDPNDA
jgi:hypothetical protein